MANIVIKSKGTRGIYVDFGAYPNPSPQGFNADDMENVRPYTKNGVDGVLIVMAGTLGQEWLVNWEAATGFMIIDTIDGVGATSIPDLIEKLTALM